jgi:hypothetical protein
MIEPWVAQELRQIERGLDTEADAPVHVTPVAVVGDGDPTP